MDYCADESRYEHMKYNRCGNSGLKLPLVSLGLWHNFGDMTNYENSRQMARRAFDLGITHFDLANNYGPRPGSAEENFGKILQQDLLPHRDELIISSKAGYPMWPGPYGDYGSRKYLIASLDQSLKRMGLEYVDIFYHHRRDLETPLEETMAALDHIVRSGRALYIGISNYYEPEDARRAFSILKDLGTPCLIHQVKYHMFQRRIEEGLLKVQEEEQVGCISFSPLAQGLLTGKYLQGIPEDSRAASGSVSLKSSDIDEKTVIRLQALNAIAKERGQSLAQMALAWNLRRPEMTSVLIGASKVSQIEDCVDVQKNLDFTDEELRLIESII